jgi:hypothetical protein
MTGPPYPDGPFRHKPLANTAPDQDHQLALLRLGLDRIGYRGIPEKLLLLAVSLSFSPLEAESGAASDLVRYFQVVFTAPIFLFPRLPSP